MSTFYLSNADSLVVNVVQELCQKRTLEEINLTTVSSLRQYASNSIIAVIK